MFFKADKNDIVLLSVDERGPGGGQRGGQRGEPQPRPAGGFPGPLHPLRRLVCFGCILCLTQLVHRTVAATRWFYTVRDLMKTTLYFGL